MDNGSFLLDTPLDVIIYILSYIQIPHDICNLQKTCKLIKDIIQRRKILRAPLLLKASEFGKFTIINNLFQNGVFDTYNIMVYNVVRYLCMDYLGHIRTDIDPRNNEYVKIFNNAINAHISRGSDIVELVCKVKDMIGDYNDKTKNREYLNRGGIELLDRLQKDRKFRINVHDNIVLRFCCLFGLRLTEDLVIREDVLKKEREYTSPYMTALDICFLMRDQYMMKILIKAGIDPCILDKGLADTIGRSDQIYADSVFDSDYMCPYEKLVFGGCGKSSRLRVDLSDEYRRNAFLSLRNYVFTYKPIKPIQFQK